MTDYKELILKQLKAITKLKEIKLEIPPDSKLGDFAFPCFQLSAKLKQNPNDIAIDLKSKVNVKHIESKVIGPYLNFFINKGQLAHDVICQILKEKDKYGTGKKKNQKIMVEFFHANTHKGVHIGHIRNISLGSALCNILEKSGNNVIRVNYQGDIGPHVAKAIWGYLNLKKKPPSKNKGVWLGKIYQISNEKSEKSKKVEQQIRELNTKIYQGDKNVRDIWTKTRNWCLEDFKKFYKSFNVKYDRLFFESEAESIGKQEFMKLLENGIARKSDGAIIVDLEKYKLGIYVGITTDGHSTYQSKDFGLAKLKWKEFKFDKSIHVVGAEQELYFKQIFKTFELMKSPLAGISTHLSYGLVMLPEGKMSSREGTMVLYEDLISELQKIASQAIKSRHTGISKTDLQNRVNQIAFGALRFSMINRENNKEIIFDKEKVLEFEGETGAYIQYAHARIYSILKKAKSLPKKVDYSLLGEEEERRLLTLLSNYPNVIKKSAKSYKPHLVARYLLELSQSFNEFYHNCQILKEKEEFRNARLHLISAVKSVLKNGLSLLGIESPEKM